MDRNKIASLDPVIIDTVQRILPEFCKDRIGNRYHKSGTKRVSAWLRFNRERPDGIFDCLHIARDFVEDDGFIYNAEAFLNIFPELPYPPGPFGDYFELRDVTPFDDFETEADVLGPVWGGGWYFLGEDLDDCQRRLPAIVENYRDHALARLDSAAARLLGDSLIQQAIVTVSELNVSKDDAREVALELLKSLGPKDLQGYPVGKIVGQLLARARGNKGWHQY